MSGTVRNRVGSLDGRHKRRGLIAPLSVCLFATLVNPGSAQSTREDAILRRGGVMEGSSDVWHLPRQITGVVVLAGASQLPGRAAIMRTCRQKTWVEGYSDRKGRFSIRLGEGRLTRPEASVSQSDDPVNGTEYSRFSAPSSDWDCQVWASLPGYESQRVPLEGRDRFDTPNIGKLVLRKRAEKTGR